MKLVPIGRTQLEASRLAYGCWRIAGSWDPAAVTPDSEAAGRRAILTAYESGYTLFDHADIYCGGRAETLFGQVLRDVPGMRNRILIATKCGIRLPGDPTPDAPHRYDFSADHIVRSCEASLKRLGVDTIDLYQLHRPDLLADPEEITTAFMKLRYAGKVREFGVSNFRPSLVDVLLKTCPMRIHVNQVEISLARLDALTDGTLDQCIAEQITPMAWSPLAGGLLGDGARQLLPSQQRYQMAPVLTVLDAIARQWGASRGTVALAWLLKHPAGIIPIVGSTQPERIQTAARAASLDLSRDEWYQLLNAARGEPLP
jgi:predicted oxidoreductase